MRDDGDISQVTDHIELFSIVALIVRDGSDYTEAARQQLPFAADICLNQEYSVLLRGGRRGERGGMLLSRTVNPQGDRLA
jgi:hypothetical protein